MADPSQVDNFPDVYASGRLDEEERVALMDILIRCIEDMGLPSVESSLLLHPIVDLPLVDAELHASSVRYWSCPGDVTLRAASGLIRVFREVIRLVDAEIRDPTTR